MRGLLDCTFFLVLLAGVAVVRSQYDDDFGAPAPPRLQIPGAVPLGPTPGAPARRPLPRLQARRQPATQQPAEPAPRLRSRPPSGRAGRLPLAPAPIANAAPQYYAPPPPPPQQRPAPQEDPIPPRPVIEESEDDFEDNFPGPLSYSPSPSTSPPPPPPTQPPQKPNPTFRPERPVFRPERPALLPTPAPELNFVSPSRQQQVRPTTPPEDVQYSRQSQSQYNRAQAVVRAPQKQVFSSSKQESDYEKPVRQHQRPRKPVAQVLNRYREDNPDGSITWGFENDDGSFKEETIGTDCVTYGKYGYIDPDGTRREYSYSTGIPCDKNKEADNQQQQSEGYIDYAENKYVLPNGDSIDLNNMVKNRARKPIQQTQYRN